MGLNGAGKVAAPPLNRSGSRNMMLIAVLLFMALMLGVSRRRCSGASGLAAAQRLVAPAALAGRKQCQQRVARRASLLVAPRAVAADIWHCGCGDALQLPRVHAP